MPSDPAQQAAAGVLEDVMADEAAVVESHQEQDAEIFGSRAPVVAEPLIPGDANEATEEVEQPQDELEVPEIAWDTPEDLKELLEAPDFDEEEEVEEFEGEGNVAPSFDDEYDDPEKEKLRKQLAKAQKKLAWAEEQKVKAARKGWEAEARKYFQFSNPDLIDAKSRRAFLKQAQAQHQAVAKVAKPVFDQLAEIKQKAKEEGLAQARAEAAQRWGSPISGPQSAHNLEDTQTLKRERLQQGQNLAKVLRGKLQRGEVNL